MVKQKDKQKALYLNADSFSNKISELTVQIEINVHDLIAMSYAVGK